MAFFRKRHDPISDRARALNAQIAALESEIERLSSEPRAESAPEPTPPPPTHQPGQPRLRSTALPHGPTLTLPGSTAHAASQAAEPIFEVVEPNRLKSSTESPFLDRDHDLGVRKNDLASFWHRFKNHFRGPATTNPKLVNYLAAGSIQGLRPLRYEKRVARNRFLLLVTVLVLVSWGIIAIYISRR